jgi:hypothetical protein
MSWAEAKKVNSRLDIPLNHSIWLSDYKAHGEDSYVYHNGDIWNELMNGIIAANDLAVNQLAISHAISMNQNVGKVISRIYGVSQDIDWASLTTISAVVGSAEAMEAIANNIIAMNAVMNCDDSRNAIKGSDTALTAINSATSGIANLKATKYGVEHVSADQGNTYEGTCVFVSGVSKIASDREDDGDSSSWTESYAFAKGTLSYTPITGDDVVVEAGGTATGSAWGGDGETFPSGTTTQPYAETTHDVNLLVKKAIVTANEAKYDTSCHCTAGGTITYIAL